MRATCSGRRSALVVTGLSGSAFLGLEVSEFARLLARGAGPTRSAFLSAFFALVGCHGLHVTAGLLWLGTMMAQFWAKGFRPSIMRRGLCFASSGTRSTSSGSAFSPSSISWELSPMSEHDTIDGRSSAPGDEDDVGEHGVADRRRATI